MTADVRPAIGQGVLHLFFKTGAAIATVSPKATAEVSSAPRTAAV